MSTTETECEKLYDEYSLGNYGTPPLTLVKGQGTKIWDDQGKEYLDFVCGIAVTAIGHSHPHWVERIREQAGELAHCSNLYRIPNQALLARKICQYAGAGKVFFCNSGAEANEVLVKLARLHGQAASGEDARQYKIIAAEHAFHGRTFGGMSATPLEKVQGGFKPMLSGFSFGNINDLDSFAELVDDETAAILLEPIQGEEGINPCSAEFLQGIRKLCDDRGLLFLVDEVQCGLGRTGDFYGFEHSGIRPDAIAMAKGLGGGFPIGAVWIDNKHAPLFKPGSHGCTFGGSPLACAASLAVFEVLEKDNLLDLIKQRSEKWFKSLNALKDKHSDLISEIRGRGYLVAVAMKDDPSEIIATLRDSGLLTVPAGGNVIRLLPPYTVSERELERSVEILDTVLSQSDSN